MHPGLSGGRAGIVLNHWVNRWACPASRSGHPTA